MATFRKSSGTSHKDTTRRNDPLKNPSDPGIPRIDVNTIDYDVQHDVVDVGQWYDGVKNISNTISLPASLSQSQHKMNRTEINKQRKERVKKGGSTIMPNSFRNKPTEVYGMFNKSHSISSNKLSYKKPYKSPERISNPLLNLMNNSTPTKLFTVHNKSKTSNTVLDDSISKLATIKKRSINKKG